MTGKVGGSQKQCYFSKKIHLVLIYSNRRVCCGFWDNAPLQFGDSRGWHLVMSKQSVSTLIYFESPNTKLTVGVGRLVLVLGP